MIEITEKDFNVKEIIQNLRKNDVGAIVSFIGTVRDFTEIVRKSGKNEMVKVEQLEYESYKDMALEKMGEIRDHVLANYDIKDIRMIHRMGILKPSDQIVMIVVSAAHRKDAFKACEYAIDELKKSVPIWKKEVTSKNEYWVGEEKDTVE